MWARRLAVALVGAAFVSVHGYLHAVVDSVTFLRAGRHGGMRPKFFPPRLAPCAMSNRAACTLRMTAAVGQAGNNPGEAVRSAADGKAVAPIPGLGLAPVETFFPQADRIVAIGDIHGDEGALIACLRMSHCIDADSNWCGGTTNVVQIGDILDRGDEERGCMDLLFKLKKQAADEGGAVHVLMGNHEVMNVDWDFDYVGLGGFDGWESREALHTPPTSILGGLLSTFTSGMGFGGAAIPRILKDRAKAFTVGTGFAALTLSEMPLAIQIGDTLCVHGGLELEYIQKGLHRINEESAAWLRGEASRPNWMGHDDNPIWNRSFSAPADRAVTPSNARKLEQVLHACGARRMIVGHTPQAGGVNSYVTQLGYEVGNLD